MKLTRRALYGMIWERPVVQVARELGISDVGLAKCCRRHAIPLPPVGYWARIAAGQRVPKPPLKGHADTEVEFAGGIPLKGAPFDAELNSKLEAALAAGVAAQSRCDDDSLGRWTRKTQKALQRRPNEQGWLFGKPDTFSVSISLATAERVIPILHVLETAMDAAGMEWAVSAQYGHVVGLMFDETISFNISETAIRTEHLTKHPRFDWNERTYTYDFQGELKIRVAGCFVGRKSWGDGKTQRLEEKLPEVIRGLIAAAVGQRLVTEERAENQRRYAEEAERRRMQDLLAYQEQVFVDSAFKEATDWNRAASLRAYANHLRASPGARPEMLSDAGRNWLSRVEAAADRIDPTR